MKKIRSILVVLWVMMLIISFSAAAFGADANVIYQGNAKDMIFEPGSEYSPSDLFPDFKDVMPGDSLTQKITVSNKAENGVKVKIFLRSLGSVDEKYNEFLNQLTLTVAKETETPMFDAAADKTAGLTDWVCLGTLYSGGSVNLNVTLDVPVTLDNMFQKQIGKIKWQFVTEEYPTDEPTWQCPDNPNHKYHIEEIAGTSTFVCEVCGKTAKMKCEVCGGDMHQVTVIEIGGETYSVYADGKNHYKSADGRVHFYLNDAGIIEYYTVDGVRTDVKDVGEYKIYQYYECLDETQHHTDPQPKSGKGAPQTGDDSHLGLWLGVAVIAIILLALLLAAKRKNRDKEEGA